MKTKRILAIVAALVLVGYLASIVFNPYRAKSYNGIVASLSVDKALYAGEPWMEVTLTYTARTGPHRLFNPFFQSLLEYPGEMLIRDDTGKIVRRLYQIHNGSLCSPTEDQYVNLDSGRSLSEKVHFVTSAISVPDRPLAQGKYSMQLVLYNRLFDFNDRNQSSIVLASQQVPFELS